MTTIYNWNEALTADTTGASGDWTIIYDTSTGRTKKCRLGNFLYGTVVGFYGATKVDQGTMTASAVTSLTTAVISAANVTTVFGFSSSTAAAAYAKRMYQIQVDLKLLMTKIDSTGLVAIAGV